MKSLFLALLAATLGTAAWLALQGPVDVVREPARLERQLAADQFRLLSEADGARLRSDAARKAAAASSAAAAAPATAAAPGDAAARGDDMPVASCIDIGGFASESATRKLHARLVAAGLGDRTTVIGADKTVILHLTGVDAAAEARIHAILKDFPHQEMIHCAEVPAAR